jgi:hypothetical protein
MVRCWNCENLVKAYSGGPSSGQLFQREFCKCKVKRFEIEHYSDLTKERECREYKESENRMKYEEIAESLKQIFTGFRKSKPL